MSVTLSATSTLMVYSGRLYRKQTERESVCYYIKHCNVTYYIENVCVVRFENVHVVIATNAVCNTTRITICNATQTLCHSQLCVGSDRVHVDIGDFS